MLLLFCSQHKEAGKEGTEAPGDGDSHERPEPGAEQSFPPSLSWAVLTGIFHVCSNSGITEPCSSCTNASKRQHNRHGEKLALCYLPQSKSRQGFMACNSVLQELSHTQWIQNKMAFNPLECVLCG